MSEVFAAARQDDLVGHGFGMLGMLAGALAGAALILGGVLSGGTLFVVAAIAGAALSGGALARGIQHATETPDPTTGRLGRGSSNVTINSRAALRTVDDAALGCHGLYTVNHMPLPVVPIAEGAATVTINGREAARLTCRLMCGAKIKTGSANVVIGGPTARVLPIIDTEQILQTILTTALVGVALIGGGIIVLEAFYVGGFIGATAAGLGYVVEIGIWMEGFELLGQLGDQIGPGWRDILQGAAGFATMFGPGQKKGSAVDEAAENLAIRSELEQLAKARAEALKGPGGLSNKQRGPVLTLLKDKLTGKIFEGRNNISNAPLDDLHPVLKDRLASFHEKYPDPKNWPHPDTPGRHSEIDAINQALWARTKQGANVTERDLNDFVLYNETLYKNRSGSVPCCANCTELIGGTRPMAGTLDGFDGQ